uniref:Uncharacterized protein n=1 Tax=Mus musculus TaxID=10090 RepID=Q3UVM6_MOUSE|nr:unnamed protein product [Mus musculus]
MKVRTRDLTRARQKFQLRAVSGPTSFCVISKVLGWVGLLLMRTQLPCDLARVKPVGLDPLRF